MPRKAPAPSSRSASRSSWAASAGEWAVGNGQWGHGTPHCPLPTAHSPATGGSVMDFHFTAEQDALRQELRGFLRETLPPDWKVENDREAMTRDQFEFSQAFARKLGERGWLTM